MSEFGILDSQYRLIETRFLDDWVVFKALEVETDRIVCIRTPNDRFLADSERYRVFQRTAPGLSGQADLSPRYYPPGVFDERDYVVSTWVDVSVQDVLNKQDVLTPEHAIRLLEQSLEALRSIATSGFVHGWLTPGQLGISEEEVVIDTFPSSSSEAPERRAYAAPEILGGEVAADERADIYALGVVAYRMLLGRDRLERAMEGLAQGDALAPLVELEPDLPETISRVIERMVSLSPEDRFRSAALAYQALREALDVTPIETTTSPSQPGVKATDQLETGFIPGQTQSAATRLRLPPAGEIRGLERPSASHSSWPAFITVAVLVLIIGGAWYAWQYVHQKRGADESMAALETTRETARVARASVLALEVYARGEQQLDEARDAYAAHRFASATRLAHEARRTFETAYQSALRQHARQSLDRAMGAYESARALEGVNMTELNSYLASIRAAENALENGDPLAGKNRLEEIEASIKTLSTYARANTIEKHIRQLSAEISNHVLTQDDTRPITATEHLEAAIDALGTGDSELALESLRRG